MAIDTKRVNNIPVGERHPPPAVPTALRKRLVVAAIDFGTTFSGYAFSFWHEFEEDPLKIHACNFSPHSGRAAQYKTTSCVLFTPDKEFHSFGHDAEEKYNELSIEGQHSDWYFFKRFKMMLYDPPELKRNVPLHDEKGKEMQAIEVFTACIKYLKDHLLGVLLEKHTERQPRLQPGDIHWILTVPAIWDDSAKQFMREAAIHAEIHTDKLSLALEPEAASLFCRYLPTVRVEGDDGPELRSFFRGDKYLVLDAGGGTVDITVHEILEDDTLKEIYKANGGQWGGATVDENFEKFLCEVLGPDVVEVLQMSVREDYAYIFKDFESKKSNIRPESDDKFTFTLPHSVSTTYKDMNNQDLQVAIQQKAEFRDSVSFGADKMRVEASVLKELFREPCDHIVGHLQEIFAQINDAGVEKILMVGGFCESPMLQHAVRTAFPGMKLVIPEDARLAVLRGAVLFGHCPTKISARVCKHTYGIEAMRHFQQGIDPESKKVRQGEFTLCKGSFSVHAMAGQEVVDGKSFGEIEYVPSQPGENKVSIAIWTSPRRYPEFVDEKNCKKIGEMIVELESKADNKGKALLVNMVFGKTELKVIAKDKATGKETKARLNFL